MSVKSHTVILDQLLKLPTLTFKYVKNVNVY